jgi:predicted RNA binding protein YcfA (HicA-like mRNA interferase family)
MPKLRVLSGHEVLKILHEFGFQTFAQRGSHVKVRRVLKGGRTQILTLPDHDEIDRGTLQRHLPPGLPIHPGVGTPGRIFYGLRLRFGSLSPSSKSVQGAEPAAKVRHVTWWMLAPVLRDSSQCRFCRAEISSSMFTNSVG